MLFVIFHGAFGSPEKNWFPDLKERLESLGQSVIAPAFSVDSWEDITNQGTSGKAHNQTLENWLHEFEKYLPEIKAADKLCFVGHSLGPLFILHVVEKYKLKLDSAIFVSPFLTKLGTEWQFDVVNKDFYNNNFDFNKLQVLIPTSYVLFSDNDPYVPSEQPKQFAEKLGSSIITVQKAAHMNSEVNLNEFPLVLELCKSRIDLSLYQRFLEHRRELFAVPYTTGSTEEMIYLNPDEVQYEGIFHFRNLRKHGFATFSTRTHFWDSQSKYMIEARKAAKRVEHFIRVFIVDKPENLERAEMKEQIEKDFEAGIEIYLCWESDVLDELAQKEEGASIDFGVWDNDYVCFVPMDTMGRVQQVRLSSRKQDLDWAANIQKTILTKSVRIHNLTTDIEQFLHTYKKGV